MRSSYEVFGSKESELDIKTGSVASCISTSSGFFGMASAISVARQIGRNDDKDNFTPFLFDVLDILPYFGREFDFRVHFKSFTFAHLNFFE